MSLFNWGKFKLHSGSKSSFLIECAYLAPEDWTTLAMLVAERIHFKDVVGVPSGGLKFAEALKFYKKNDPNLPILIVDDVLTTGKSMETIKKKMGVDAYCVGIVLFARGKPPWWVTPIFQMNFNFSKEG